MDVTHPMGHVPLVPLGNQFQLVTPLSGGPEFGKPEVSGAVL